MTPLDVPKPMANIVYLDHHASTPLLKEVIEAIQPWLERGYGNPSNSLHKYGKEAREAVEWSRHQVASLINATPEEIIFTSGATEANNLALSGGMAAHPEPRSLLISNMEHESVAKPAKQIARDGVALYVIKGDSQGFITPESVEKIMKEHSVSLVSVIAVHGEIGAINPIPDIAEIVHEQGALLHTDAAQAVGKIPVDVRNWSVDYLTIAGHKMYGPKGVGALYKRKGAPLEPILFGASHEKGLRPGTENVPAIVGFGAACAVAENDVKTEAERQRKLRDTLHQRLVESIPDLRINGPMEKRHPGNLHISFRGIDSVELLEYLPQYALSVGSACHSDNPMENPLIQTLQIPAGYARGSIRIGMGRSTTGEQLEQFAFDITEAYHKILSDKE